MVGFAGYQMPLRYEAGTIAEHLHCRSKASLFDVGHMGVIEITGSDRARMLERLVPSDILSLPAGRLRYTFFTNEAGGILDDVVITNTGDRLVAVANASRKEDDVAHLQAALEGDAKAELLPDRAIVALQGPRAVSAIAGLFPGASELSFMDGMSALADGARVLVSRSGYTGEDGFEIIVPSGAVSGMVRSLLEHPDVELAGLGARDTLRLEAGLCLYGQDLDDSTTPVEAGLTWAMQKRRRQEGGFVGWDVIRHQLHSGPGRIRVGIQPSGKAPVRAGDRLVDRRGEPRGTVTSGGYGPSVAKPVAMGYVEAESSALGTPLIALVRGREVACTVAQLPFVPHRYQRGATT